MSDITDCDEIHDSIPVSHSPLATDRQLVIFSPQVYLGMLATCRGCGKVLDIGFRISGGLGPSLIECPRCHGIAHSHRQEWADMTWGQKVSYLCLSIFYAVGSVLLTALFTRWGHGLWYKLKGLRIISSNSIENYLYELFPCFGGVLVVCLLQVRIMNSKSRTFQSPRKPRKPTLTGLDFGMQWKFVLNLLLASRLQASFWLSLRSREFVWPWSW